MGILHRVRDVFLICLLTVPIAGAAEPDVQPARFANAAEIEQLIRFPEDALRADVLIRGGGVANRLGLLFPSVYADRSDTFRPYEDEVFRVLRRLRVVPARVDGKVKETWFNFSVIFKNLNGERRIRIVPNLQYEAALYGEDYTDPQRMTLGPYSYCSEASPFWTLTRVDSQGKALSSNITAGRRARRNSPEKYCHDRAVRRALSGTYIPAQHNGTFVAASHVELW